MTAEQKLEKCKELVRDWRKGVPAYKGDDDVINDTKAQCADELQAVLEETDE